jgi:hypothetical protein
VHVGIQTIAVPHEDLEVGREPRKVAEAKRAIHTEILIIDDAVLQLREGLPGLDVGQERTVRVPVGEVLIERT